MHRRSYKYKCMCVPRIVYTLFRSHCTLSLSLPLREMIPLHLQVMLCGKPPFWGNYNEQLRRSGRCFASGIKKLRSNSIKQLRILYNLT